MVDLHNHVLPGMDDGAVDLDETRAAIESMVAQGVGTLVTTPHIEGSLSLRPGPLDEFLDRVDAVWGQVKDLVAEEFPEMHLERGVELKLDTPNPDCSDPRLRLASASFVLVEFPGMSVPPNSANSLAQLKKNGWTPIVAHPERYTDVSGGLALFEEWKRVGAFLQVNCGSLLGRYGDAARTTAWRLLHRGEVDYLASDYHARGRCPVAEARERLVARGGAEQAHLLLESNPQRVLADQQPEPVPPLEEGGGPLWRRLLRLGRD